MPFTLCTQYRPNYTTTLFRLYAAHTFREQNPTLKSTMYLIGQKRNKRTLKLIISAHSTGVLQQPWKKVEKRVKLN